MGLVSPRVDHRRRLLRLVPGLDPRSGGIVSSILATSIALDEDYDVSIATLDEDAAHHEPLRQTGIEVLPIGPRSRELRYLIGGSDLVTVEGAWNRMAPLAARRCQDEGTPYLYVPHGSLSRLVKDAYPGRHLKKLAYWAMVERRIASSALLTWYASESEQLQSEGTFPGMPTNGSVIPLASRDVGDGCRAPRDPTNPLRVVTAGRVTAVKDIDVAIRALAGPGIPWTLTVAGPEDDRCAIDLRELAGRLGVADRVRWMGFLYQESLVAVVRSSDAYLCAGLESFGMSVAEALSSGLPVVASDAVALAPLLGDAGTVFTRGDHRQLAASIAEVADRTAQGAYGDSPRRTWEEHCSPRGFIGAFGRALR